MGKTVTFFYDFSSPYTYLAYTQLPALVERTGAQIDFVPIGVLDVMKQVNNTPTTLECAVKGQYAFKDLTRWAVRYQVPLSPSPYFGKYDPSLAYQGAIVASGRGCLEAYNKALFDAVWVEGINLGDIDSFRDYLDAAGIADAAGLLAEASQPEIVERLQKNNSRAVEAGVFGSPSFTVEGELFFGNDRLDFLEQTLLT